MKVPAETAELLATLAYAQNGVLGQGAGEKQHVWMLERLGRLAIDRREYKIAKTYLQRALKITESLPDEMFRLSTINNLIVAFGQRGDLERTLKYLEMAAPICNSYMSESTFAVDVIMEKSSPTVVQWWWAIAASRRRTNLRRIKAKQTTATQAPRVGYEGSRSCQVFA